MLINRIGDLAILISIFTIYYIFNTLDYNIVFIQTPFMLNSNIYINNFRLSGLDLICITLFIGCMGKSAQIGLHT